MGNSYFSFRQFIIHHDKCAMKVGTDGVLLGAWANPDDAQNVLDVGTGTGLIAVMIAQRCNAVIHAVEIDRNASSQAQENINTCPWNNRIHLFHHSFQHFAESAPLPYDLIVSNPPYFRNALKPSVKSRSLARHDDGLSYEGLLFHSVRILSDKGRIAVIIPAAEADHFVETACLYGLFPKRKMIVKPLPSKPASRCMLELSRIHNESCKEDILTIRGDDHISYTEEYKALTKDYYL